MELHCTRWRGQGSAKLSVDSTPCRDPGQGPGPHSSWGPLTSPQCELCSADSLGWGTWAPALTLLLMHTHLSETQFAYL